MKHEYVIIIGKAKNKYLYDYMYDYGKTKNVELKISQQSVMIKAKIGCLYPFEDILSAKCYLFPDAIKKALLLHIILFSEGLNTSNIKVQIDDEINDQLKLDIYSMIDGKLLHHMTDHWQEKGALDEILHQTKSHLDERMSSLYALICSKSKKYEVERFMYLWMSFNGMYGYLAHLVKKCTKRTITSETKEIMAMQKFLGYSPKTLKRDDPNTSKFFYEVRNIIQNYDGQNITKDSLERGQDKKLARQINSLLKEYNMDAYCYLLTQFAYNLRCKIFHASKRVNLFSYAEEDDIKCLKFINNLIEEYIDNNLYIWFNDSYVKRHMEKVIYDNIQFYEKLGNSNSQGVKR